MCSMYLQEVSVCLEKVNYLQDSVTFSFLNDVTEPIYIGLSILYDKRVWGGGSGLLVQEGPGCLERVNYFL